MTRGEKPGAPRSGIPTLVVHGKNDTMAALEEARDYVQRTGARLVVLNAGHFAMLVRSEEYGRAIRAFVGSVLAQPTSRS